MLGVDYNRIFVNQSRESPAIFQHDERYFLITSGTTGWSPNPSRWATSTDLMGAWTEKGDPFPWWAQSNSWNSQPSSVIPVDPAHGKYIYMGDRWNGGGSGLTTHDGVAADQHGRRRQHALGEGTAEWKLEHLDAYAAWDVTGVPTSLAVGATFRCPPSRSPRMGRPPRRR